MTALPKFDPWAHVAAGRGDGRESLAELATLAAAPVRSEFSAAGIPAEWAVEIADLHLVDPPARISAERWRRLISDAERLLRDWAAPAVALGWSTIDLFGCSPGFARRLDRDGLAMLLEGRPVLAITAQTATIGNRSGSVNTYRRAVKPGAIPIWQAAKERDDGKK